MFAKERMYSDEWKKRRDRAYAASETHRQHRRQIEIKRAVQRRYFGSAVRLKTSVDSLYSGVMYGSLPKPAPMSESEKAELDKDSETFTPVLRSVDANDPPGRLIGEIDAH